VTEAFPGAILPHRLDFGTSGVMTVGLHAASAKSLNRQFQDRLVKKEYVAMLDGWVADDVGSISAAIAKDRECFPRVKICEETGKKAVSEYSVINRFDHPRGRRSLVKFSPLTGRTHQLRIHSQVLGHPILGCDLYQNNQSEATADRLMLHASDLYIEHPASGELVHGLSECPFEECN